MSLWCDKYRPKTLAELDFNRPQAAMLKKLLANENFPHLAVFGTSGSGKMTRVKALLYELFDVSSTKLRIESKVYEAPSGKKIEQRYVTSNFHIEVNPSESGFYDRVVVQQLLKDVATSDSLSKRHPFKVVVVHEADRLTREAQQGLRRTLEKYVSSCRVILVGERVSRLIPALKSRCLAVRNAAPSAAEITAILQKVATLEDFSSPALPAAIKKIVDGCDGNLRRAILMLQAFACNQEAAGSSKNSTAILSFRWQELINKLATSLVESQSPRKVGEIRTILSELQVHLIPPELVLRLLLLQLLPRCLDGEMSGQLIRLAAAVDQRLALGSKSLIHLELFAIQFMALFRCSIESIAFDLECSMDF